MEVRQIRAPIIRAPIIRAPILRAPIIRGQLIILSQKNQIVLIIKGRYKIILNTIIPIIFIIIIAMA